MNEWVEILMSLTNGNWNSLDSSGEGLSQYCGIVRFATVLRSLTGDLGNVCVLPLGSGYPLLARLLVQPLVVASVVPLRSLKTAMVYGDRTISRL